MRQTKINITKEYKTCYIAKTKTEMVEIYEKKLLVREGKVTPNGKEFQIWVH